MKSANDVADIIQMDDDDLFREASPRTCPSEGLRSVAFDGPSFLQALKDGIECRGADSLNGASD